MTAEEQLKRLLTLGNMDGVAASGTATFSIPRNGTYHNLKLKCLTSAAAAVSVANMKADIELIRVKMNGAIIHEYSATQILLLEQYYGAKNDVANTAGIINIPFVPPHLEEPNAKKFYPIGMLNEKGSQGVYNFSLEVKLASDLTGGVSTITVMAEHSKKETGIGLLYTIKPITLSKSSTGEHVVNDFPHGIQGEGLFGLHIEETGSAVVTKVEIQNGSEMIYQDLDKSIVLPEIQLKHGFTAQSGYVSVPFTNYNEMDGFLPLSLRSIQPKITWGTAAPNTYDVLLERVTRIPA